MYIKNGIAYASELIPELEVVQVKYTGNMQLLVTFSTGETRLLDAFDLISMPAFSSLQDEALFKVCEIDHGALTWDHGNIDIAPEGLYDITYEYQSPLVAV